MRKVVLLTSFFIVTPFLLISSIFFLYILTFHNQSASYRSYFRPAQSVVYAALPTNQNIFLAEIDHKDRRVENVRQFLTQYGSVLLPHAQEIVEAADLHGLDYRLIPAIAMQESNLCKKAPKESHNCWGFGMYGKNRLTFDSYSEAISTITKTLEDDYIKQGLKTPDEIMTRYTPSNNGAWAFAVNYFMNQMQ